MLSDYYLAVVQDGPGLGPVWAHSKKPASRRLLYT